MRLLPKEVEALWTLFTAPVVWAAHFLCCYVAAAVHCAGAGPAFSFATLRTGVLAATVVALAAIILAAALAWRQWGFGTGDPPHDEPTRDDRLLFQGYATLLLSGLSFVAVTYQALPVLFLADCRP